MKKKAQGTRFKGKGIKPLTCTLLDTFVKSRISPPLVGGDKGEGDITS